MATPNPNSENSRPGEASTSACFSETEPPVMTMPAIAPATAVNDGCTRRLEEARLLLRGRTGSPLYRPEWDDALVRLLLLQWIAMTVLLVGFLLAYSRLRFGVWITDSASVLLLFVPAIAAGGAVGAAYRRRERQSNRSRR